MVVLFAVAAGDGGGGSDITNAAPSLAQRNWTSQKILHPFLAQAFFDLTWQYLKWINQNCIFSTKIK